MKTSIKKLYSTVVVIFIIITIMVMSFAMFNHVRVSVREKNLQTIENVIGKAADELISRIDNLNRLSDSLCKNSRLFELASYDTDDFFLKNDIRYDFKNEYTKLSGLVMNDVYHRSAGALYIYDEYPIADEYPKNEISDLLLLGNSQKIYGYSDNGLLDNLDLEDLTFVSAKNNSLMFAQEIVDNSSYLYKPLGINVVQIDVKTHFEKYKRMDFLSGHCFFISDAKGDIVYSDSDCDESMVLSLVNEYKTNKEKMFYYDKDEKITCMVYPLSHGLKLYTYSDISSFVDEGIRQRTKEIILFSGILALILIAVLNIILDKMTKQIRVLASEMENFDKHNELSVKSNIVEIQQLIDSFKKMSKKIDSLISEARKKGIKEKELEFKLLHSQINPHFLYNALDSIAWVAIKNNQEDIVNMISALSDNFRYSIKNLDNLICFSDETKFIVDFLTLQEMTRKIKICMKLSCSENIKKLYVPKFLLQPVVENSIIHGTSDGRKKININIEAVISNDSLVIIVSDDGIGFDADKLNRFLNGDNNIFENERIGIKNVNKRIKLKYGDEYGLSYSNECGLFKAIISIPVIETQV